MHIAVDIGYSAVKAISETGQKVTFPSVVAPTDENPLKGLFKSGVDHQVLIRNRDSKRFLVGNAALHALSATATLSREKPPEMHDALLLTAAALLDADEANLAVGLPLAYYKSQKDVLKRRLQGLSAWVSVDSKPGKYISFNRVVVIPQGVGAILAMQKQYPSGGYVGLLDIGCYTTDYLLLEPKNGSLAPIPGAYGSFEVGVHLVERALAETYQEMTGAPLPSRRHREILLSAAKGNPVPYRGQNIDLSDAYEKAKDTVGRQITQIILAEWADRADSLVSIIMAGGGALVFNNILNQLNVEVPDDPTFANALGFLRCMTRQL